MPKTHQRRLNVIMFTDIVGYTAMMQHDERKAMQNVDRYKQVHQKWAGNFNGNIIKLYGDGSLTLFDSVLNAVKCAAEIQKELQIEPKVPIRIGIHIGEVIFTEDDIYGDGINLASRIQALGVEGSVLFSADVHDKIKNQPEFPGALLGKFKLKNVREEMNVYALGSPGLRVPTRSEMIKLGILDSWSKKQLKKARAWWNLKAFRYVVIILALLILAVLVNLQVKYSIQKKKLLTKTLPQLKETSWLDYPYDPRAFDIYIEALDYEKQVGENEDLYQIWKNISKRLTIYSDPEGANMYIKPYQRPDTSWYYIGNTPINNIRFPKGIYRVKLEKEGYTIKEDIINYHIQWASDKADTIQYKVFLPDELPEKMVFIKGNPNLRPYLPGGSSLKPSQVKDFLADKFEVTNAEYKSFVDAGGYKNPEFWKYPFVKLGDTLSWEKAMEYFKDKTGWLGPSDWEIGTYPKGKDDFPVSGVSWYEAAAYSSFKGKDLPSFYHWILMNAKGVVAEIMQSGNFNDESKVRVKSTNNLGPNGIYDMAGNVSEWLFNATLDHLKRWTAGANYKEPDYQYMWPQSYDPWTRSEMIGFRCIKYLNDTLKSVLNVAFNGSAKGYVEEEVVSDEIFEYFKERWSYEQKPLHPIVLKEIKKEAYKIQHVKFEVPYEDNPLMLFVVLPLNAVPPYQTVIHFPGMDGRMKTNLDTTTFDNQFQFDFYLKSGRAVILPICYSFYGRGLRWGEKGFNVLVHDSYNVMDIRLTCDYIYQNDSLDNNKICFTGFSLGGMRSPFVLGVENRINLGIIGSCGLKKWPGDPEWRDMIHYLPRIKIPILLMGGRYDPSYPAPDQQAFLDYLGTPDEDIRWVTFATGHSLPRAEVINESLAFVDKYFGKVKIKEP